MRKLATILFITHLAATAQQSAPVLPKSTVKFESTSQLVVVNVSAKTKSGEPVEGLKASRDAGTRFLLVGLSPAAREVLQLSRLLKIFETFDTEEAALAG